MLKWKIFRNKTIATSWWIIMSILFCLPASSLPKENWLDQIHVDKLVHGGLFAVLFFLWKSSFGWEFKGGNLILLLITALYGLMVEFVQLWWVPNRSFDLFDVVADITGSMIGLLIWLWVYKNKPL